MARTTRQKRDFLRLTDLSRQELLELLERAAEYKATVLLTGESMMLSAPSW